MDSLAIEALPILSVNIWIPGDSHLSIFVTEFIVSAIIYWIIFWQLWQYTQSLDKTPKQCLVFSTTTISMINSFLMLSCVYDFFYLERWKSPIIDEPQLTGHIWAIVNGYMFTDLIAHLICFYNYDKTQIPRRYDIIFHHGLIILWWIICEFPEFDKAWALLSSVFVVEITTIFLNLQYYGKYFKMKKLEKISKLLFVILWFPIRPTITLYCCYWFATNWIEINEVYPFHVMSMLTVIAFTMVPLQFIWTGFIILKCKKECISSRTKSC